MNVAKVPPKAPKAPREPPEIVALSVETFAEAAWKPAKAMAHTLSRKGPALWRRRKPKLEPLPAYLPAVLCIAVHHPSRVLGLAHPLSSEAPPVCAPGSSLWDCPVELVTGLRLAHVQDLDLAVANS